MSISATARRDFQRALGEVNVLTDRAQLRSYECDGLTGYRVVPGLVLLPHTAEQVAEAVRVCAAHGLPFVARGAGTGLSGGALPVADGVVISLQRLRRVLEVDPVDRRAVLEPGVTNLEITRAAAPYGLYYAPDPSSQQVCTIGGNVAENSGGAHCFKYGFTTNYILGLEVVLADGTIARLQRDQPGYDLLAAFVGSEGTLGITTEVMLRVIPAPESIRTMLAFFGDTAAAGEAVSAIVDAGIVPGAIEMMDQLSIEAAEQATGAGYRLDAGAALLVEVDGAREECESSLSRLQQMCEAAGAFEVRVAQSDAERDLIWRTRKAAFASMGRISPAYYVQDGVIPRTRLAAVLREIDALAQRYRLRVANVFHAGDGNLHPLVCYDDGVAGEPERAEQLAGKIIQACVDAGGSITGEHGVGVDKRDYMPSMFTEADLEAFRRLRLAFDPEGLANPGKVMPTPRLCGEVPGPYRTHPLERAGIAERM